MEGDFQVLAGATKQSEPKLKVSVRWLDGKQVRFEKQFADIPLRQAPKLVGTDSVVGWWEHESKLEGTSGLPPAGDDISDRQRVELLAAQAQRFARAGFFETAVALREAVLLVEPENHAERLLLLRNYPSVRNSVYAAARNNRGDQKGKKRGRSSFHISPFHIKRAVT